MQSPHTLLREKVAQLPLAPGVYLYKDAAAKIIYVGKAKILRARVRSYFNEDKLSDAIEKGDDKEIQNAMAELKKRLNDYLNEMQKNAEKDQAKGRFEVNYRVPVFLGDRVGQRRGEVVRMLAGAWRFSRRCALDKAGVFDRHAAAEYHRRAHAWARAE